LICQAQPGQGPRETNKQPSLFCRRKACDCHFHISGSYDRLPPGIRFWQFSSAPRAIPGFPESPRCGAVRLPRAIEPAREVVEYALPIARAGGLAAEPAIEHRSGSDHQHDAHHLRIAEGMVNLEGGVLHRRRLFVPNTLGEGIGLFCLRWR
jgi:hypothetical protein